MDPNADTYRMNIEKEGDEEIDWEEEEEGIGERKMGRGKEENRRERGIGRGGWEREIGKVREEEIDQKKKSIV